MKNCAGCVWWKPNRIEIKEGALRLCLNPKISRETPDGFCCEHHLGAEATEVNVPQHIKKGFDMPKNDNAVGPVEVLIVTHAKDFPWLQYCLKALGRFCWGFQGVTVAHPIREADVFYKLAERFPFRLHLHGYNEVPGKGMLQHMVKMAEADLIVEPSTRYVMHLDADCIFRTPTLPEHYFMDDKPVYLMRSYDSLTTEDPRNPGTKVISDCAQWKAPTEAQLGLPVQFFTMCRHPTVFPVEFYKQYRQHIETAQMKPFEQYMLAGRNEFPQDRMDFTAMGAYAYEFMRNQFYWLNIELNPPPKDRQKCYWSHGGITDEIRSEIEGFLA